MEDSSEGHSPTKERMSRSAGDAARPQQRHGTSASIPNLPPRPPSEGLSLAASKKLEKEREKEAKRLRKKEEKDRRRRSKSEKKTRKKKEKGKVSFPTAEQPPFTLQPASFQSDGWSCSACTYWNSANATSCEICTSERIQRVPASSFGEGALLFASVDSVDGVTLRDVMTSTGPVHQPTWWFCSVCTFRNLPAAVVCDACDTPRSPTALIDVEGLPSPFPEASASTSTRADFDEAGTTRRRSREDKKDGKGHRRMPTVDRQENDDFWVPEADEESDEADNTSIVVDRNHLKKLSRSDNSLPSNHDDEVLRAEVKEEIDRREKELEREQEDKRRAEEARRKKEEEDSIPLELALIEKTEFYCAHDHWEDELYSDDDDSSDPAEELLENAFEDRSGKHDEYYSEDGGTAGASTNASQCRQSQRRTRTSGGSTSSSKLKSSTEGHIRNSSSNSNYEVVESSQQRDSYDPDERDDPPGIDVYELVAETAATATATSSFTNDRATYSGYEDEEEGNELDAERRRREQQQGYTVVNGRQHLMESRVDKSDHYRYDPDDNADETLRQEATPPKTKDADRRQPPTQPATRDISLDEEELMAQLLAAYDPTATEGQGRSVKALEDVSSSANRRTEDKHKDEKGLNKKDKKKKKKTKAAQKNYAPTHEDNYLEDVVEAVERLRTEKKSKKAQLRDSLYYTDGGDGDDGDGGSGDSETESETETETETETESESEGSAGNSGTAQSVPDNRVGNGVQDSGDRRAQEAADEEEELFRLALLRTSGEDKDKETKDGASHKTAAHTQRQPPPTLTVSPSLPPVVVVIAPSDPSANLAPINPAKLAYAALAPVPSTTLSSSSSSSSDETRSARGSSATARRRGGRSTSGSSNLPPPRVQSATQSLMLSTNMRSSEHSRKIAVMSKKSDQYLHDMIVGCQALFPIVATHFVRLQSVYELRQKLQRFVGMQLESQESQESKRRADDDVRQRNLIPRLQRAIRVARRANFLLYGDVGNNMRFIGTVYTSAELAVRANDSLFQITCDYLYSLISTEELAAIYRGAMMRSSSTSKSSCHTAICSFARERHQLRLSTTELKRANDLLKRTITQRSVLDVLQSSALSLVQATRQLLVQFKQEEQREGDLGGMAAYLPSSNLYTPRTASATRDERRHQVEWLENAVRSVESRLCVEEDRDSFSISKTEKELETGQAALINRGQQADKLCTLAKDFVAAAKMYGKIIISEVFLPYKQKTIKPISIGGVAGGEKYIHRGILFKFAMDWEGLYGGDEYSAKVASHELKGLARYFSCAVRGLHFPLMALIDYRGFRLTASSILPISHADTLVYGSCDMGATVKDDNKVLSKLMEKAGRQMNIKGHLAGKNGDAFLYAPTDIEGHLGRDRRFYVLDFARTFPPATPNIQTHPRGFLYQLLRPEFVFAYHKPLSSDAFMVFGKKSNAVDNPEIRDATNHLLNTVIPGFASWLGRHFEEDDERVLASKLSVLLHREGINNRYLGVVRIHCRNPRLRHFLLREMIARVIKNIMRAEMRDKTKNVHWQRMAQAPSPSQPRIELGLTEAEDQNQEISFSMVIARFFNVIIGLEGERSKEFWEGQMRQKIEHSFPEAQLSQVPIRLSSTDFLPLFERIQQLGGIRLSKQVLKELEETPEKVIFAYPDITKLRSRVTHMNIVEESEALSMKLTALKTDNEHLALRMLRYSRDHYEAAVRASTDNPKTLYRLADVLKELAKREPGPRDLKIELGDSSIERFLNAYELNRSDEKVIYQTGNVACELGEAIRSAHFFVKARECYVTALKLGSQPHYEKEVTEKALALMEKAETNLDVVDFEGAFQLFRAVLTVRPDDVLIIFLCAEICFSWARTLGDSKDGTSPPYKKAIKYYQKVVDIARNTNKTASPSVEERQQPNTHSDALSKRPRLPFLNELEGMSHVLTSTSESYEKFLNNIIGKGGKKRSRDKFRPSHAARTIGGGMHMMLSSLSEHHLHHASGSSEGSPVSSPSPRGSSSRRTWHRKEKREKEKEKEKEKERDLKKTRKHSKKDGHHVEEMTTPTPASSETLSPPSFGRRLSLKLPRSPRGGGSSSEDGGEAAEAAPPRHANSSPQLPIPPHSASTATTSSSPSHHHLVSKLFSSTRRFSSAGKKEAHKDKWGTAEFTTTLQSGLDIEAERKKKEAEDLRKKEEKEREDKRQQERERERRVRDPWRCIYVLFRLRLAFYNDLTRSFPGLGMFWLRMGHMLVEHVHEAMLTHDLQPSQEKEFLDQAAGHYAKALTLNPNYVAILQQDHDSLYITDDGDPRTEAPPGAIEALYRPMRDILQVAQKSSILQVELGNACSKLQMRRLFLAPVALQISDPTLTAIIKGGSGGVPLALEELSLSCCAQVSGTCLERLAPYLANTLTTLRLKGLTEGPTQQYCSLIKSCKRLQQLSMPHCCYQDTYKPLQILYTHCRNLTSLDFGVMSVICWKDEFEDLARGSQGLTSLDLYYLHNLTSSFVDQFLSECKHLRRLRLPCLTPYAVKKSSKRRADDGDVGKQPIEGGGISYSDEVLKKWAHKYSNSFAKLEELHMDGYSNLTYSSMLPLVETFKSLRVLHLENNRGLDDRCLIRLTSHCTSLTTLHLAHCVNIGDASLTVVARTCPQLSILNVALTKIGGGGVEAIAQHCRQLRELSLGCPFRLRDDVLKNLIYNSFVNLKKLALFRAAKAQLKYSINAARTKGIKVEYDRNTMLPAYVAKKCLEARKEEIKHVIRRTFSEDITEQAGALRLLAYEYFVPFDSSKAEDNKRYFAKLGGIPRLLKLMGPGNHHEVRIKATKAVWNFAGTEELQRLLLGEGVLGPIIDSLQAVIPELQEASAGALWPYLEFEDVGEKALELGVVEALLPIMNTAKVQPRWHMLGCLVAIAQNVSCAKEVVAKGGARISEYCSNPAELLITRYLAAVTLGFLSLDSILEDDLIDDGALEKIENFMFEAKSPEAITCSEDSVTNDQGIKWKFIRPFLRLTYSRHPPVQRLGAFALATLSKRPVNVKTMVEEGLIGRLVCLSWSHDSRLRQLIGITLKAIFDRYDATIGKSIAIVPSLEQIAIHTIQHDGNLCGLSAWLATPESGKLSEALRQRMEIKVLLASRQNLEKKVVYRGGPLA